MIDLADLGGYPDRGSGRPVGLTLHDLAELLRRVGKHAGFEVQSEYKCHDHNDQAIDWVWLRGSDVAAAFEIEGRDVDHKSAKRDVVKLTSPRLRAHGCAVRAIVLFQVNHDLGPKKDVGDPKHRIAAWDCMSTGEVEVYLDVDLLDERQMTSIVARARGR